MLLEYHCFGSVFSKQEAQRFPKPKPYDHAMDLLPNSPQTLDCKVYPLAPGEQVTLYAFLKEHLLENTFDTLNPHLLPPSFRLKERWKATTSTGLSQIK